MKKHLSLFVIIIFLTSIILQGCSVQNKPFVRKDFNDSSSLKVIRYETPKHRVYSSGSMVVAIVIGGVLFGGLGAIGGYAIHHMTTIESSNPEIPDFGKMVMDKFVERSQKEIKGWPKMNVQETILKDKEVLPAEGSGYRIEFVVDDIRIEKGSGLLINTIITMKNKEGEIIAEKNYVYDSTNFGRIYTYETLAADNFKKLKEEYVIAADKTVDDLVNYFDDPKVTSQK